MNRREQAEKSLQDFIEMLNELGFNVQFIHVCFYDEVLKQAGHLNSTALVKEKP